jgi:DNA primase
MAITPQWKDELRARITLSSLVQRSVKLTRAGREWKGCCPFHDEKTPSFYVNDQKQFYHCFGCGAHGDAISWMVDHAGLQFIDAIKELAGEAGMEVPAPDPQMAKRAEQRASLIDVTEAAQRFFTESLAAPGGKVARDYLERRGFAPAVCREFGFGWAPEDRQALPKALAQFGEEMLEGAGMRAANEQGERYDRFRGRVMLPIQDARVAMVISAQPKRAALPAKQHPLFTAMRSERPRSAAQRAKVGTESPATCVLTSVSPGRPPPPSVNITTGRDSRPARSKRRSSFW